MTISFKYKAIKRSDGRKVKTPTIPIALIGKSSIRTETIALLDLGADLPVIPQDIDDLLDLNINKKDKSKGIGGEVEVANTNVSINIEKDH